MSESARERPNPCKPSDLLFSLLDFFLRSNYRIHLRADAMSIHVVTHREGDHTQYKRRQKHYLYSFHDRATLSPLAGSGRSADARKYPYPYAATAASSFRSPRATICNVPLFNGRWSFMACSAGAVIQCSISASVVRITGIAFG